MTLHVYCLLSLSHTVNLRIVCCPVLNLSLLQYSHFQYYSQCKFFDMYKTCPQYSAPTPSIIRSASFSHVYYSQPTTLYIYSACQHNLEVFVQCSHSQYYSQCKFFTCIIIASPPHCIYSACQHNLEVYISEIIFNSGLQHATNFKVGTGNANALESLLI